MVSQDALRQNAALQGKTLFITSTSLYGAPVHPRVLVPLVLLSAFGLLLRTLGATHPFESSDNAELALRVIENRGISWIFLEKYGLLNPLTIKVFAAVWSDALAQGLTEALFKLPVALLGAGQSVLAFFFARRLGATSAACVLIALMSAVFPLHVMQSRYLWGYEVFGLFFLTLALWSLFNFFETPGHHSAVTAGVAVALYLVSHGFIVPFFAGASLFLWLRGVRTSRALLWRHKVLWIIPLLYLPLTASALRHTADKKAKFGFYLFSYLEPMLANVGIPLALAAALAFAAYLRSKRLSPYVLPVLGFGVCYFLPLIFGARPGTTVTRGYMLIGSYLVVFSGALALDSVLRQWGSATLNRAAAAVSILVLSATAWGTYESIFDRDLGFDPTGIRGERGVVPLDPGSKTAGLYVRRYIKTPVLSLATSLEPPNVRYYFGDGSEGYYDTELQDLARELERRGAQFDALVVDPTLQPSAEFVEVADIRAEGASVLRIFAKPELQLPKVKWDVEQMNRVFDSEYPVIARF
ncbi:MAG: hypothetical protein AAFQ82_11800 [Myxococcota bacterium]